MRTPLAWTLRVTISPWSSLPDFLKEPMVAMSFLLGCSSPRPSRPRWRSEGRRRSTPHPLGAGAQRRMAAAGLSWLARNGRRRVPALAGVASPGEESLAAAIAARRSRLAVLWPDHAIKRPREVARQTALQGEDVADIGPCKRPGFTGEGTETLAYRRAVAAIRDQAQRSHADTGVCSAGDSGAVGLKPREDRV